MAPRRAVLVLLAGLAAACGKKGPPLAPLYLVPTAVTDVAARRADDRVRLRFTLPARNENGPGIDLDRVEIFAVTVPPGGVTPPNRLLLGREYLAGRIDVRPVPEDGAPPADGDTRPAPGDAVTFVEALTPDVVTARPAQQPPAIAGPGAAIAGPPVTASPATGLPVTPLHPQPGWPKEGVIEVPQTVRIYVVRGVARNGRSGPPSARITVPLGPAPEAPGGLTARNTEKAVVVEWLPGLASVGGGALKYQVYKADDPDLPLNPAPLDAPTFEQPGVGAGTEVCYRVRAARAAGPVVLESPPSPPACVTAADVFPPAPPKGLAAVATAGAVQLIWDPNAEPDLAGYLVLRAASPDETLQPLTPTPIRDTVYRDTAVQAGVRYVYAIVAVDSASPANRSEPSERAEATVR